jgi:hypothetical protein
MGTKPRATASAKNKKPHENIREAHQKGIVYPCKNLIMATAAMAAGTGVQVAFLRHPAQFKRLGHIFRHGLLQLLHVLLGVQSTPCERVKQRLQFRFGLRGIGQGLGNFLAQQLPVTPTESMDRYTHCAFGEFQRGGGLRVRDLALAHHQERLQLFI